MPTALSASRGSLGIGGTGSIAKQVTTTRPSTATVSVSQIQAAPPRIRSPTVAESTTSTNASEATCGAAAGKKNSPTTRAIAAIAATCPAR